MDWREFLEKNADINDHYDDINEKTARNQSNYYKRDFKYNKDKKEITDNGRPNCTNCDANAQETRKKFPKAQLKRMVGTVRHDGKDKEHAWNINPKGHIIDGARDQFGDEKKIHIIKPNDKKHKEYTTGESHINRTPDHLYGRARKKLNRTRDRTFNEGSYKRSEDEKKITTGMESLKSWELWLEKTEPTGLTARQKKLAKEIADGDKDDHTQYYTKASWETWLEKEEKPKERDYLAEMQTLGNQNMYQNSSKKKKFLKEAKGAGKKIEQQMGENKLPLSYSNRLRTNIKRPAERVTDNDLSDLDGWVEETKSWESWLEKNDPCWEGYEQYGMKDKNGKKVPNCVKKADESKPLNKPMRDDGNKKFKVFVRDPSTGNIVTVRFGDPNMEIKRDNPERRSSFRARHKCSEQKDITSAAYWSCKMWEKTSSVSDNVNKSNWEVWLEKNNAIETSHKEDEKKHEWDGKFSSSTIRDDVKDDDDKAVSEEESLEELTDGKLEEVEKLKSWELWLEKDALNPDSKDKPSLMNTQRFARISTEVRGGNAQGGKLGDASLRGMRAEEKKRGKKYKWKNPDRKGRGGEKKELYHGTERQAGNYPALGTDSGKESGEKFAKLFQEEKKSWELWLEKDSLDGKQSPDGLPKLTAGGKKVLEEAEEVINRDTRGKKNEMYKSWLEKMQGAGDARFGNQHLTGLDQKPVDNEEDEANILPEKEQKTDNKEEKQEKTEDKEDKDNKPYKALSQE